jgi:hydrogenase-4 component F
VTGDLKHSLHWIDIARMADKLNPQIVKIAFIFILIGYGTKAGLAPMHTWMPDAHSQAPSPVSALLSGVLLKCAIYGIIRYHIIVKKCAGGVYSDHLLIIFGVLSLLFATFFILVQSDIKRLFAYSSLEHIGLISVGLGFGGAVGLFGALLHTVNHAITKTLMFCTAGEIIARYKSRSILRIAGVVTAFPLTGIALLAGGFALAGSPPFGIFISELMILKAGFAGGHAAAAVIVLAALVLIFAGLIKHISGMAFGQPPADVQRVANRWGVPVLAVLGIMMTLTGLYLPSFLTQTIRQCVDIINGAV